MAGSRAKVRQGQKVSSNHNARPADKNVGAKLKIKKIKQITHRTEGSHRASATTLHQVDCPHLHTACTVAAICASHNVLSLDSKGATDGSNRASATTLHQVECPHLHTACTVAAICASHKILSLDQRCNRRQQPRLSDDSPPSRLPTSSHSLHGCRNLCIPQDLES